MHIKNLQRPIYSCHPPGVIRGFIKGNITASKNKFVEFKFEKICNQNRGYTGRTPGSNVSLAYNNKTRGKTCFFQRSKDEANEI